MATNRDADTQRSQDRGIAARSHEFRRYEQVDQPHSYRLSEASAHDSDTETFDDSFQVRVYDMSGLLAEDLFTISPAPSEAGLQALDHRTGEWVHPVRDLTGPLLSDSHGPARGRCPMQSQAPDSLPQILCGR